MRKREGIGTQEVLPQKRRSRVLVMKEKKKSGCENRTHVNLGFISKKDGCSSIELFHSDLCGLDGQLRRERK